MARLALDQALPAHWIDEVFEQNRQRQYPRELLFSSIVELMSLVALGLSPSLHAAAAARKMADRLPVSLAALYAKVQRTEPAVLRALVQGSAQRLTPLVDCLPERSSLPGWQLRVFDGNHLPAPLRGFRGAALPGHTLVVYDPDSALVCDIVACENAYESERTGAAALIERAQAQQLWIGDRHFCTQAIMQGLAERGASFIVREHTKHPRLQQQGAWSTPAPIETGQVREQPIDLVLGEGESGVHARCRWRRIEIELTTPTDSGDQIIVLWSNLPPDIDAATIAQLYRKRWRIEGMFGRLESVLHSEVKTLGHPRAALLGFAVAVLAYNVLALLKQLIEHAHRQRHPELDVSTYHLAVDITSDYATLLRLLPTEQWPRADDDPGQLVERLLRLGSRMSAKQLATSKRKPKAAQAKGYVEGSIACSHVSTARALKQAVHVKIVVACITPFFEFGSLLRRVPPSQG